MGGSIGGWQHLLTIKNCKKRLARTGDAALHGSDRAIADLGCLFVSEAAGADENECLALFDRQCLQRACCVGQFRSPSLSVAGTRNAFRSFGIPRRLPPGTAAIRVKLVSQNRKEPSLQVGAGNKGSARLPCLDERLLREIVCALMPAGERSGKGAQEGDKRQQIGLELCRIRSAVRSLRSVFMRCGQFEPFSEESSVPASIFLRRSMNSSGTGSCTTVS